MGCIYFEAVLNDFVSKLVEMNELSAITWVPCILRDPIFVPIHFGRLTPISQLL